MKTSAALCLGLMGFLLSFAHPALALREMDPVNDPARLFEQYENRISLLPASGSVAAPLWSDTYWASRDGGAAARWQMSSLGEPVSPRDYGILAPWQILQLSEAQLNSLSPAEKYDIAVGRYDLPTVKHELMRTHATDPKWFGLCHAVASVTTRYYEPQTTPVLVVMPNGQRRQILFYSSDIKALLALAADKTVETAPGIGERCNKSVATAQGACWDTNPASFYIAVTNMIGLARQSLIIDVDPLQEVWNAAVKSYSAKLTPMATINPRAAPETVRQVRVDMSLQHTIGMKPSANANGGRFKTELYSFTLELDQDDQIVGGEWITSNRPDSVWATGRDFALDPHFSFLEQLVQPKPL